MVWFIVSMLTWGLVGSIVFKLLRHLNDKVGGVITYRIKVNKPIDLMAMEEYLAQKPIQAEDGDADRMTALQKVIWADADTLKWEGYVPKIELLYDIKHGFLLSAYMQITRKASEPARLRPDNMKTRLFTELQEAGVLTPDDAAEIIDSSRRVSTKPAALDKGDDPMAALRGAFARALDRALGGAATVARSCADARAPRGVVNLSAMPRRQVLPRDPLWYADLRSLARGGRHQVRRQAVAGRPDYQGQRRCVALPRRKGSRGWWARARRAR